MFRLFAGGRGEMKGISTLRRGLECVSRVDVDIEDTRGRDNGHELKGWLGNVRVEVTDGRVPIRWGRVVIGYRAEVVSVGDYYSFGAEIRERSYEVALGYRWGYQAQEKDNEIYGRGASYYHKYRQQDARLGRFWSVDPLSGKYPYYSPYSFSGNRLVDAVEWEGLEPKELPKEEGEIRMARWGTSGPFKAWVGSRQDLGEGGMGGGGRWSLLLPTIEIIERKRSPLLEAEGSVSVLWSEGKRGSFPFLFRLNAQKIGVDFGATIDQQSLSLLSASLGLSDNWIGDFEGLSMELRKEAFFVSKYFGYGVQFEFYEGGIERKEYSISIPGVGISLNLAKLQAPLRSDSGEEVTSERTKLTLSWGIGGSVAVFGFGADAKAEIKANILDVHTVKKEK